MEENVRKFAYVEDLVAKYIADPSGDLRDVIIVRCSGLVERIARKFAGMEPVDDLIQVGYIGLLNSLSKFDPTAGVRFNTYATHLVAGEIKHYLRDRSMTIRHPAWLQELRHKVNKAGLTLQASLGRVPTPREVAENLAVPLSSIEEVIWTADLLKVGSLDSHGNEDPNQESEVERLDSNLIVGEQTSVEERVLLEQAMEQLRELERDVLVLFHFESLNQTEIASRLGISCNYVSHILRQSLAKLRRILTNEDAMDRALQMRQVNDVTHVTDPETGLYTYVYFKSRLTEELHRVKSLGGAVGIIRVHFSGIRISNDGFAGQTIREFIVDAGHALRDLTRSLDLVCRDGQYGFVVIIPGQGEVVPAASERIEREMRRWLVGRIGTASPMRMEIGCAFSPEDGTTCAALVAAADPQAETRMPKAS